MSPLSPRQQRIQLCLTVIRDRLDLIERLMKEDAAGARAAAKTAAKVKKVAKKVKRATAKKVKRTTAKKRPAKKAAKKTAKRAARKIANAKAVSASARQPSERSRYAKSV